MLERRLTGPGAQDPVRLTGLRLTARQCAKNLPPGIACRGPIGGGIQNLDAIAGPHVEDFARPEAVAQAGQARANLRFRQGKPGDFIHAHMAIGEPHHADLVHGESRPRRNPASVTEWSSAGA